MSQALLETQHRFYGMLAAKNKTCEQKGEVQGGRECCCELQTSYLPLVPCRSE